MPQTIQGFLALAGVIVLVLTIIGGNVKIIGLEIPKLEGGTRWALFAVAAVMLYISYSIYSSPGIDVAFDRAPR